MAKDFAPSLDASLGLVYRLNSLWNKADWAALKGKYDEWNNILDALYRNLLYRESMEIEEDENTKEVKSVKFKKKDVKAYAFLSKKVSDRRKEYYLCKDPTKKRVFRSKWYHAVQKKDIWLRKFMQTLKLYLKENEKRPGSAMFGAFGRPK